LDAAEQAFSSDGLDVPLDEIARRAGVGAGTVYRHFPSKEYLFEAVVFDRLQRLVDEARSLASSKDLGEAFFGFLSHMVEELLTKKDLIDALAGFGMDVDVSGAGVLRELRERVAELLDNAQRTGAVREDVGAADVMALITGTALAIRRHGARDDEASGRILGILCDGLRQGR
jgi:AcrR family transcriptional regulator